MNFIKRFANFILNLAPEPPVSTPAPTPEALKHSIVLGTKAYYMLDCNGDRLYANVIDVIEPYPSTFYVKFYIDGSDVITPSSLYIKDFLEFYKRNDETYIPLTNMIE